MKLRVILKLSAPRLLASNWLEKLHTVLDADQHDIEKQGDTLSFYHPQEIWEDDDGEFEQDFIDFFVDNEALLRTLALEKVIVHFDIFTGFNEQCAWELLLSQKYHYLMDHWPTSMTWAITVVQDTLMCVDDYDIEGY